MDASHEPLWKQTILHACLRVSKLCHLYLCRLPEMAGLIVTCLMVADLFTTMIGTALIAWPSRGPVNYGKKIPSQF